MTKFEVPGWTVGVEPVHEQDTAPSKKRKRSVNRDHQALEVNFDKVMEKLKSTVGGHEKKKEGNKREKKKLRGRRKSGVSQVALLNISKPKPLQPRISVDEESIRPVKRAKTHQNSVSPSTIASTLTLAPKLTTLQQGLKQSLDGARFRMINEAFYKSESSEAHKLMQDDPKIFDDYHIGFRRQVQSWPTNPVDYYITALSSYPARTVIADLGCGDATLARALRPRGLNVLSYDLVSDGEYVIEADVFERIPLPGSERANQEKTNGYAQVVDVVVCALSLMGTNWPKCLREAWRVLKPEGELKIAEVTSRFTCVEDFQDLVRSIGFRLKSKDESNTHFTLFEFKKAARKHKTDDDWVNLISRRDILKPCEYKRR